MASYAPFAVFQRGGLFHDPSMGMIAATGGNSWLNGAVLTVTAGLLVEGGQTQTTNVYGVANSPFTLAITASGGSAIGTEVQPAVGGGTAISGVRRTFTLGMGVTFIGSLDNAAGQGTIALSVADIGNTAYSLRSVNAAGALTNPGGFWIVDRAASTGVPCRVLRLIDPPGAKFGDTPIPGINSGQALVEFAIVTSALATAY